MFHTIPEKIMRRMQYLEDIDQQDRHDGTPRLRRLRQLPQETGRFIALLAASAPAGKYIEIGTSAGYSTLWLALACRAVDRTITTFEILVEKVRLAQETFEYAEVNDVVTLVHDDARKHVKECKDISFCFLDAEKESYEDCYEVVIPHMVKGGILIADNAINHQEALKTMLARAHSDTRVDALVVPIGKGELMCKKL